jgi:ATP-dependent DNA helicase UvrD/PcrA
MTLKLNFDQQKAVERVNGRVLILAGAGSGKTRVITERICHLINHYHISPDKILGLTFTNKASEEMRERVAVSIGHSTAKKVMLSTFHSFCLYILRSDISLLGFTKYFTIYDEKDVKRLIKQILKDYLLTEEIPAIDPIYDAISQSKNLAIPCENKEIAIVFKRLNDTLKAFNALDFDSLLSVTVELFKTHPKILEKYQDQFQYIMIDEYQDTNPIQFELAELLAKKHQNLCVVGDDDQSIYGWRGAQVENILNFEADYIVKLQENYRSCQNILDVANNVIEKNTKRYQKKLYSKKTNNQPIELFHAPTDADEAKAVVDRIISFKQKGYKFKDIAILYRSNMLSRTFELELMHASWKHDDRWIRGIPYAIFGGVEFSERAEIKDLFAYLRLIVNRKDEEALLRILNIPRRGISDQCIVNLTSYNRRKQIPLWDLLKRLSKNPLFFDEKISLKALRAIKDFVALIEATEDNFNSNPLHIALKTFIEKANLKQAVFEDVKSEKMREFKLENLQECIATIKAYEEDIKNPTLCDFISTSQLAKQNIFGKKNKQQDGVQLMTFHSSKGLEFPICFLVGLEDHIIPHEKSIHTTGLEEERRLFYVGVTRCQKQLFLSMSRIRKKMGKPIKTTPSRFLFEIPKEYLTLKSYKTFN